MKDSNGSTVHWALTDKARSCHQVSEFETDLMKHIDEHMSPEEKKKQGDLFE